MKYCWVAGGGCLIAAFVGLIHKPTNAAIARSSYWFNYRVGRWSALPRLVQIPRLPQRVYCFIQGSREATSPECGKGREPKSPRAGSSTKEAGTRTGQS